MVDTREMEQGELPLGMNPLLQSLLQQALAFALAHKDQIVTVLINLFVQANKIEGGAGVDDLPSPLREATVGFLTTPTKETLTQMTTAFNNAGVSTQAASAAILNDAYVNIPQ